MSHPERFRGVVLSLAALLASLGCAHESDERLRIPEGPPRTLELISESDRGEGAAFPRASALTRRDECGIPLAVAPEALLAPGGIVLIQQRLVERGLLDEQVYELGDLDAATLAALRDLQVKVDLPDVGLPTYATVRALGLDPVSVFLSGDPACKEPPT